MSFFGGIAVFIAPASNSVSVLVRECVSLAAGGIGGWARSYVGCPLGRRRAGGLRNWDVFALDPPEDERV